MFPQLETYLHGCSDEFPMIPEKRRGILAEVTQFTRERSIAGDTADLLFICTHNSRRSQFAHVWAEVVAWYMKFDAVRNFSGGTEVSACAPATIAALQRCGFITTKESETGNPHYLVSFSDERPPIVLFSKACTHATNPQSGFCAVMMCADADEACPIVTGAMKRVSLSYNDPKRSDGTTEEQHIYDMRCREIAREMLYTFSIL